MKKSMRHWKWGNAFSVVMTTVICALIPPVNALAVVAITVNVLCLMIPDEWYEVET